MPTDEGIDVVEQKFIEQQKLKKPLPVPPPPPPLTTVQLQAMKDQRLAAMALAQQQARMLPQWSRTNQEFRKVQQYQQQPHPTQPVPTNPLTPHWAAPTPFETHNPLWRPATPFEPNRDNPLSPDWMLPTPTPPRKEASSQGVEQNDPQDKFAMTERANNRRAWEEMMAAKNYFNPLDSLAKGAPKETFQANPWQGYGYGDGYGDGGGYTGGGGYSGYASWISNLTSWNIG